MPVERLAHAVVALADERAQPDESFPQRGEILDRVDLPREVVEADAVRSGDGRVGADREQAEVVMVLGVRSRA